MPTAKVLSVCPQCHKTHIVNADLTKPPKSYLQLTCPACPPGHSPVRIFTPEEIAEVEKTYFIDRPPLNKPVTVKPYR